MNRWTRTTMIAGMLSFTLLTAGAAAADFIIDWWTVDTGGGTSSGGGFELSGTIAQPDASLVAMSGGGFEVSGGFWPAVLVTPPLLGDLDGDGDVDAQDLAFLLSSFGLSMGDPGFNPAADLDNDGKVDSQDLALLLSNWGVDA